MNWRGYQDSAGRPIAVGDKVRFRGTIHTIKAFHDGEGNRGGPACARIEFNEEQQTPEPASEFSVDLMS